VCVFVQPCANRRRMHFTQFMYAGCTSACRLITTNQHTYKRNPINWRKSEKGLNGDGDMEIACEREIDRDSQREKMHGDAYASEIDWKWHFAKRFPLWEQFSQWFNLNRHLFWWTMSLRTACCMKKPLSKERSLAQKINGVKCTTFFFFLFQRTWKVHIRNNISF